MESEQEKLKWTLPILGYTEKLSNYFVVSSYASSMLTYFVYYNKRLISNDNNPELPVEWLRTAWREAGEGWTQVQGVAHHPNSLPTLVAGDSERN